MSYLITTSAGDGYQLATHASLQKAINSLSESGGTVWVWTNITLRRPIEMAGGVTVDFLNHRVTIPDKYRPERTSFVHFGTSASFACVKNAEVVMSSTAGSPLILLQAEGEDSAWLQGVLVENIRFINTSASADTSEGFDHHTQDAIVVRAGAGGVIDGNTLQGLRFQGIRCGVRLDKASGPENIIRNNFFHDLFFDGCESLIRFSSVGDATGYACNLFSHVRGRAYTYTLAGVENIAGEANHFEHVSIDRWELSFDPNAPDWSISDQALHTYICAHKIIHLRDLGSQETIVDPPNALMTSLDISHPPHIILTDQQHFSARQRSLPLDALGGRYQ